MRKLKQYGSAMMLGVTPQPSEAKAAAPAAVGEANKVHMMLLRPETLILLQVFGDARGKKKHVKK